MDTIDWAPYRYARDGFGLAILKPEGGWYIGGASTPILSGPPGTKPQDHPDYLLVKELYGLD